MNEKIQQPLAWEDWGDCEPVNPNPKPPEKTERKAGARLARENPIGKKFGRLSVVSAAEDKLYYLHGRVQRYDRWNCVCECGNATIVRGSAIRCGGTISCGCLQRESTSKSSITHGQSAATGNTKTYRIWKAMKTRCTNPNQPGAKNYVNKGISVCDRWLNSFENFLEDMGMCPKEMSIDRIKNDLGYYKDNCRWATRKEQQNNTTKNHFLEHDGKRLTISQWADELKINAHTLYYRIKNGTPTSEALTTPVRKCVRNKT